METFESATKQYLKQATFLGDDDMPLVIALKKCAAWLDENGVQAAMVNQYRLIINTLNEKANADSGEVDPLEALLDD